MNPRSAGFYPLFLRVVVTFSFFLLIAVWGVHHSNVHRRSGHATEFLIAKTSVYTSEDPGPNEIATLEQGTKNEVASTAIPIVSPIGASTAAQTPPGIVGEVSQSPHRHDSTAGPGVAVTNTSQEITAVGIDLVSKAVVKGFGQINGCDLEWRYIPTEKETKRRIAEAQSCPFFTREANMFCSNDEERHESILQWRPFLCGEEALLPPNEKEWFDILSKYQIGFIGDSLLRNHFVSLFCALYQENPDLYELTSESVTVRGFRKSNYGLSLSSGGLQHRYVEIPVVYADDEDFSAGPEFSGPVWALDKSVKAALDQYDLLVMNFGHHNERLSKLGWFTSWDFKYDNLPVDPFLLEEVARAARDLILSHPRVQSKEVKVIVTSYHPRHGNNQECVQDSPKENAFAYSFTPESLLRPENIVVPTDQTREWETLAYNSVLHRVMVDELPKGDRVFEWLDVTTASFNRYDAHDGYVTPNVCDITHYCVPGIPDLWSALLYPKIKELLSV